MTMIGLLMSMVIIEFVAMCVPKQSLLQIVNLNGVKIHDVSKLLADRPSVTIYAIQLVDPLDVSHLLIILLQLHGVMN